MPYLDDLGRPGATVAHDTARIGDGEDMAARGVISHVNRAAAALGCAVGQTAMVCAEAMRAAPAPSGDVPSYQEARFLFSEDQMEPLVWGVDSASLLRPEDAGQVVLTAEGVCHGRITRHPQGDQGFGYDPFFLIQEYHQTFAELGLRVKHHLSHRARAVRQLIPKITALRGQ